jgi:DHA2 family multidrug resistance protein-like MFS transporter
MPHHQSGRAHRKEWIGLAVLAFPCLLLSMDFTVLHLAVPSLTASLKPSSAQLLWIVDIYGFMIAGSLITMGTLGDRIGRRKLLLIGAATFGAASVIAAFSGTAAILIASRALLGVAGATLMPSTLALIRNMFHDPDQRRKAIAIWINAFIIGGAIGPILGGVMLDHFWWGSVFLLNVPVMVLLLIFGPRLLPEFRDSNAGRLDLFSAALSLVAILFVIYGIKQIAQEGSPSVAAFTIAIGIILGIAFVLRQRKLEHPLIDMNLFAVPAFSASVGTQLVAAMTTAGIYFLVVQYLQLVVGLSPLKSALWLLPQTFSGIAGTMLAPYLGKRFRAAHIIAAGMGLCAIGMLVLTQIVGDSEIMVFEIAYVTMSLGMCAAMTLTTDLMMSVAPPERAGAASAISETSGELGLALGVALLGSIGTASYRRLMAGSLPAGIDGEAANIARATLGGAVSTAKNIGGAIEIKLLDVSRDAFGQSLEIVALISAVLVLATSVVILMLARNRSGEPHSL